MLTESSEHRVKIIVIGKFGGRGPTLRLGLLEIGARIRETADRIRIAFAAACPDAALFRHLAIALWPAPA